MNNSRIGLGMVWMACTLAACSSVEPKIAPPGSSYACQSAQAKGMPSNGQGDYGCHFFLLHPQTGKVLANTPYHLAVLSAADLPGAKPKTILEVNETTDDQGRSAFVRANIPITPENITFVERIGAGPYGTSPRLIRASDGEVVIRAQYYFTYCGGKSYTGITDERGNGVMFMFETACDVNVTFYRKK